MDAGKKSSFHTQLIRRHKELTGFIIKKVTNIRTLCDIMNANPAAKRMCPDLHSLFKLYMTVPIRTAIPLKEHSQL